MTTIPFLAAGRRGRLLPVQESYVLARLGGAAVST